MFYFEGILDLRDNLQNSTVCNLNFPNGNIFYNHGVIVKTWKSTLF